MAEPLAYFLTFRTRGSWLPGDARGYTAAGSTHESLLRPPSLDWEERIGGYMSEPPAKLSDSQRECVASAIRDVCQHRGWPLLAVNVRTNHVHIVLRSAGTPEIVMGVFKAWATRRLRDAGLSPRSGPVWARHGSTRYLWSERDVESACFYVIHGQSKPGVRRFDEWMRPD